MVRGDAPTVAMVHATPAAMAPAVAAFGERFPEAGLWHLLDDRLVSDAEQAGGLVPSLRRRMLSLIGHAVSGGADGVLLTCSMYGPVARLAAQLWDRPVAGSDEAIYQRVAAERPTRVAVLGSRRRRLPTPPSASQVADPGRGPGRALPGAARAAMAGDGEALLASLRSAAEPWSARSMCFCSGSTRDAAQRAPGGLGVPVWSPAHVAADVWRGGCGRPADAVPGGPRLGCVPTTTPRDRRGQRAAPGGLGTSCCSAGPPGWTAADADAVVVALKSRNLPPATPWPSRWPPGGGSGSRGSASCTSSTARPSTRPTTAHRDGADACWRPPGCRYGGLPTAPSTAAPCTRATVRRRPAAVGVLHAHHR